MRNRDNNCGDTPQKWLAKVTMGSASLIALLCLACSRENEVYQDPCADPNVRVGQHETEQIEPADKHEGRFSVHRYEFSGKGPARLLRCPVDIHQVERLERISDSE